MTNAIFYRYGTQNEVDIANSPICTDESVLLYLSQIGLILNIGKIHPFLVKGIEVLAGRKIHCTRGL